LEERKKTHGEKKTSDVVPGTGRKKRNQVRTFLGVENEATTGAKKTKGENTNDEEN